MMRQDAGFEVTDRIRVTYPEADGDVTARFEEHGDWIAAETLAVAVEAGADLAVARAYARPAGPGTPVTRPGRLTRTRIGPYWDWHAASVQGRPKEDFPIAMSLARRAIVPVAAFASLLLHVSAALRCSPLRRPRPGRPRTAVSSRSRA